MSNWISAEGKDCRACKHGKVDPNFTVQTVLVCSSPRVIKERAGDLQACSVARCMQGRCSPIGRFWEAKV